MKGRYCPRFVEPRFLFLSGFVDFGLKGLKTVSLPAGTRSSLNDALVTYF